MLRLGLTQSKVIVEESLPSKISAVIINIVRTTEGKASQDGQHLNDSSPKGEGRRGVWQWRDADTNKRLKWISWR
jgi:hypothetical protein